MGFLSKLVLAPLAPVYGVVALGRRLEEMAADELWGEEAVRRQLAELQEALDAGELSEAEYDEAEAEILARLEEIRRAAWEEAPHDGT